MNFTKIKLSKDGDVVIRWNTSSGKDSVSHELESFDRPEPEFKGALQALVPEVLKLLEVPKDYGKGLTVIGVSLSYNDDQGMGCVVTCLKELAGANAPLVLNTPHLPEESEHTPTMSTAMRNAIDELCARAQRYVNGQREQQDMFADAVADLAPKPGSGIESVTLSAGGKSVTLKQGDGERIRRGRRAGLKEEVAGAFEEAGILR